MAANKESQQPMKIVLLTNEYPPNVYDGARVYVEYLVRGFEFLRDFLLPGFISITGLVR
jgi:hypothetical protein